MLAFRGELDHGPLVEFSDFDALGNIAALLEESADAHAGFAQLLAEPAMRDIDAPHGRPAVFGIVRGGGTIFAFELGDIGARRADLLVQSAALRIGDGAGWTLRFDLVIDEGIEQELFPNVLEEVLLPPALEHAIGHLDVAQVPSARVHVLLMGAVAQTRHWPQAQPALEKAHRLIVQKILHQSPVELGATADEPSLIDPTAPALAIGQHVEAALDHLDEQFRAPAAAVEDDGDPPLPAQLPHLAKQP